MKVYGESTFVVGDFNTLLSEMDISSRQKVSKDRVELNNTVNQLGTVDICRLLYPSTAEHTCYLSSFEVFIRIDDSLGHKTHFDKFKRL